MDAYGGREALAVIFCHPTTEELGLARLNAVDAVSPRPALTRSDTCFDTFHSLYKKLWEGDCEIKQFVRASVRKQSQRVVARLRKEEQEREAAQKIAAEEAATAAAMASDTQESETANDSINEKTPRKRGKTKSRGKTGKTRSRGKQRNSSSSTKGTTAVDYCNSIPQIHYTPPPVQVVVESKTLPSASPHFGVKDFLAAHKQFVELHGTLTTSSIMPIMNAMNANATNAMNTNLKLDVMNAMNTDAMNSKPSTQKLGSLSDRIAVLETNITGCASQGGLLPRLNDLETMVFGNRSDSQSLQQRIEALESL